VLDPSRTMNFSITIWTCASICPRCVYVHRNQLDTSGAMLDRMETIRLSGYITAEKLQIARNHLWPKLLERSGWRATGSPSARSAAPDHRGYAREAGCAIWKNNWAGSCAKARCKSSRVARTDRGGAAGFGQLLGKPPFKTETPMSASAWSPVWLGPPWRCDAHVEASLVHSKNRGFKLTGRLGEVMQESANIAYTTQRHLEGIRLIQVLRRSLCPPAVPEGATPKDGPSAASPWPPPAVAGARPAAEPTAGDDRRMT